MEPEPKIICRVDGEQLELNNVICHHIGNGLASLKQYVHLSETSTSRIVLTKNIEQIFSLDSRIDLEVTFDYRDKRIGFSTFFVQGLIFHGETVALAYSDEDTWYLIKEFPLKRLYHVAPHYSNIEPS
jgi:hypothetical protein